MITKFGGTLLSLIPTRENKLTFTPENIAAIHKGIGIIEKNIDVPIIRTTNPTTNVIIKSII
jgi:hypothetical protein